MTAAGKSGVGTEGMLWVEYLGENKGREPWTGHVSRQTYYFSGMAGPVDNPGKHTMKMVDVRDIPALLAQLRGGKPLFRLVVERNEKEGLTGSSSGVSEGAGAQVVTAPDTGGKPEPGQAEVIETAVEVKADAGRPAEVIKTAVETAPVISASIAARELAAQESLDLADIFLALSLAEGEKVTVRHVNEYLANKATK